MEPPGIILSSMRLHKNTKHTYEAYAKIYDTYKGDRSDNIGQVSDLIEKYQPDAVELLDLACGTGAIAQGLVDRSTIVGVDNSQTMLEIAQNKLPAMRFVHANMINFNLHETFDVVYCLHNSVNHLLSFGEWEEMFHNVANHLRSGGIFIFDIATIEKLNEMIKHGLGIKQVGKDYVATEVTHDAKKRHCTTGAQKSFYIRSKIIFY